MGIGQSLDIIDWKRSCVIWCRNLVMEGIGTNLGVILKIRKMNIINENTPNFSKKELKIWKAVTETRDRAIISLKKLIKI